MYQVSQWALPNTCEDPETTFKFLNLMFGSEAICNLLHNGIEGRHYVRTSSPWIITYPEGVNVTNTGYNNPLGIWGDKSKKYQWEPISPTYFDDLKAFNAQINSSVASKALGYAFNTSPVRTEYAAVSDVITQYITVLGAGAVDPAVELPRFLRALNDAGINTVIAENQRQLDAWLASR